LDRRKQALEALLGFGGALSEISAVLAEFSWDSSSELVTLKGDKFSAILKRYLAGDLSASDVENWANLVESRDDIDYSAYSEEIHVLANPVLEGPITREVAMRYFEKCGET
jgi:hypothetical protein